MGTRVLVLARREGAFRLIVGCELGSTELSEVSRNDRDANARVHRFCLRWTVTARPPKIAVHPFQRGTASSKLGAVAQLGERCVRKGANALFTRLDLSTYFVVFYRVRLISDRPQ